MDVVNELQRWGCAVDAIEGTKAKVQCPLPGHTDENPSCVINLADADGYDQGSFYCPVCQSGGDFFKLLGLLTGQPRAAYKRAYTVKCRAIKLNKLEVWNSAFSKSGHVTASSQAAMRELEGRGVSPKTVNQYWLGWDAEQKTITIPIMWGDRYVDVRRYRPGGKPKFSHYAKGYGLVQTLFPQNQLIFNKIVLCGGEVKALAVLQRMNQFGFGAVSQCHGEGSWHTDLSPWLIGKEVFVCYDVDGPGRDAAEKICAILSNKVKWVGKVELPLDPVVYPTGDINDYFMQENAAPEEFLALLKKVPEWEAPSANDPYTIEPNKVRLDELVGYEQPFNFATTAYISGVDDSVAHKMPQEIRATCSNDAEVCSICKMQQRPGFEPMEGVLERIDGRNPVCTRLVGVDKSKQRAGFKDYFGIPESCNKCRFEESDKLLTVRYALLSDTEAETDNPIQATIITNGEKLHYGDVCFLEGRADQSPLTTEEVRLVTAHQPKDILTEYKVQHKDKLEAFRTKDDSYEALDDRIASIMHDLERNVTFIYNRKTVHLLFDLAFHSPLWVPYANSVEPGWISVLIVSDTAQGKSTIMRRLISHYGYGAYIDAANTTIAGLIGGVKTVGKRQFLKWGVLPQNDKRLVCIEEYANAQAELLRAMRAARDSGVVKLDKIDKGAAKARTRTIVLSNPKTLIPLGAVVDGLMLLEDLVERPEDLRRFDIGMWIPKLEIDEWHKSEAPMYDSETCHELITWAWTIPTDNIHFDAAATKAIRNSKMSKDFPFLHLVGGREFESKLARISAALAARTYSEHNDCLIIQERHVHWVENFLRSIYDDPDFGYATRLRNEATMDEACQLDQLVLVVRELGSPATFIEFCLQYNKFRRDDLKAATGDYMLYEKVYQQLLILGCIVPVDDTKWCNAYYPTRRFKKLLPKLKEHFLANAQAPTYM